MRRITNLQLRGRTNSTQPRERSRLLLCFSGIWRAKFSKILRLACESRGIYNEIFGLLVRFGRELRDTREDLFRISNFSYSVALNAAHK